jgi:hypothetical protein
MTSLFSSPNAVRSQVAASVSQVKGTNALRRVLQACGSLALQREERCAVYSVLFHDAGIPSDT